jgi:hypothetical protein
MAEHPIEAKRRAEWEKLRRGGLWPFAIRRGLLRGIPMGLGIILLLELLQGREIGSSTLRDPGVLGRFVVAVLLFSLAGVLSAYGRWRALDLRYGAGRAEE